MRTGEVRTGGRGKEEGGERSRKEIVLPGSRRRTRPGRIKGRQQVLQRWPNERSWQKSDSSISHVTITFHFVLPSLDPIPLCAY